MCKDGSLDKCQESDFKETVSCNLRNCSKTFGDWNDVGPCIADGDDPMCGPGKQNQTRICTHDTVLNCTDADRNQIVPCSLPDCPCILPDCPKKLSEWDSPGVCIGTNPNSTCDATGSGHRVQKRNCTDGTKEKCHLSDMERHLWSVICELPKCPSKIPDINEYYGYFAEFFTIFHFL